MNQPVTVRAEGLSKHYVRGRNSDMTSVFDRWMKRPDQGFFAIKDVSFELRRGEVVGLIGRNGSGKSTLFKVLSRITTPSHGRAEIFGRCATMLEVGTGFHPDLTGRENISLSGQILGMRPHEIAKKLDSIIDFSGVGEFLDTPVKHYSSGMYVRLGFAVAAHLDADVLLVDEILAVGDQAFQQKCLQTIAGIGREDRTVVLVSHSMPNIVSVCDRALRLEGGHLVDFGPARDVVTAYSREVAGSIPYREWSADEAPGDAIARLRSVRVIDESENTHAVIKCHRAFWIEVTYTSTNTKRVPCPSFRMFNVDGHRIVAGICPMELVERRADGMFVARARVSCDVLDDGTYTLGICVSSFYPGREHVKADGVVGFGLSVVDHHGKPRERAVLQAITRIPVSWGSGSVQAMIA